MTRAPKPLIDAPPANEQAEIEAMLRRLEELRRSAGNNDLRRAYEAAVGSLETVFYRLVMLRAPGSAPKSSAPGSRTEAAAQTGAARKPRRR